MFPRVEVVHLYRLLSNCLFHVSFSASFALCYFRLNCPIRIPLKILHEKPELSTTIINIITIKPRGPYLPLFLGKKN